MLKTFLRDRKRRTTVPATIVAGIMALSAAAWACTPAAPESFTEVQPDAGARGSLFTASAGGVTSNTVFELHFIDRIQLQSAQCHHGGSILATPTSTSFGRISGVTVQVPRTAASGAAEICFAQQGNQGNFSRPDSFTVL